MRSDPATTEDRQTELSEPGDLLGSGLPHLFDERSDPDFRAVFGLLARRAGSLDAAVAHIRITGLDLRPEELRSLDRIRVLLAGLNGVTLRSEAEATLADPAKASNLRNLVSLMEEGRIEVRSAPLAGWAPDFTVFHRKGRPWTLLVGPHWFARPYPHRGPALASLHGPGASARTAVRFSQLWLSGHDVGTPILDLLHDAERRTGRSAGPRRSQPFRGGSTPPFRRRKTPVKPGHSPDMNSPETS